MSDTWMLGTGLLIARVVLGSLMVAHGGQKLFGWLGGYGLKGTAGFFEQLGFRPGVLFAAAASLGEIASGLLVAFGLLGPIGPALMISVMLVAILTVHVRNGLFASTNGIEVPLLFATAALAFGLIGYGPLSLDGLFGIRAWWTPAVTVVVLAGGVLGGLANLAARARPSPLAP